MAKKYREVREALKGAGWQVLRQTGLTRSGAAQATMLALSLPARTAILSPRGRALAFVEQAVWSSFDE